MAVRIHTKNNVRASDKSVKGFPRLLNLYTIISYLVALGLVLVFQLQVLGVFHVYGQETVPKDFENRTS